MAPSRHVLQLSCPNRRGIVAAVAGALHQSGGDILEAHQFEDLETRRFFMRVRFEVLAPEGAARFAASMTALAAELALEWRLSEAARPKRTLLLVSRADHCLLDLLYRHRIGELGMQVAAVVSNHPRESLAQVALGDIPFVHLPVEPGGKPAQEARLLELVDETRAEFIVLARYMQILTPPTARALEGRCINIHHGFLPGFKGAKPYHQAHARGVKLIGATAHFVTADLDEGPIIEQDVERVSHADSPEDLIRKGRDIERRVLARAVQLFLEDRILLDGAKCIVFRE